MNPAVYVPIVAALCTASATITAGTISARAALRSVRKSEEIHREVATPPEDPSIAVMIPELFKETFRQGAQIDAVTERLERHIREHGDLS